MAKSPESLRLDAIVRALAPELKQAGFRRKGRAFNRVVEDGLVHVIHFWGGPAHSIVRGKYAVDLGVHIREVYELNSRASAAS
jgi:hypothetical protein